jgi:hypothetical protein
MDNPSEVSKKFPKILYLLSTANMSKKSWNLGTLQKVFQNVATDRNHLVGKRHHSSLDYGEFHLEMFLVFVDRSS